MGVVALDEPALLLDTMAVIYWYADSPALPPPARNAMLMALSRPIYVSAVSAFEIATKARIGKLRVPPALLDDFPYIVESDGFRTLDLDIAAAVHAGRWPTLHRDPFDRLLAAQAATRALTVVSGDRIFASAFGCEVLWD